MIEIYQEQALRSLRALSDEQLKRGMAAFAHHPRGQSCPIPGDPSGCFCFEAFQTRGWRNENLAERMALSVCYESYTEWFQSECIRESAERGWWPEKKHPVESAIV